VHPLRDARPSHEGLGPAADFDGEVLVSVNAVDQALPVGRWRVLAVPFDVGRNHPMAMRQEAELDFLRFQLQHGCLLGQLALATRRSSRTRTHRLW
jgi:hypothetical protein